MKQIILTLLGIWYMNANEIKAQAFTQKFPDEYRNVQTAIAAMFPNPTISNTTIILNYLPQQRIIIDVVDYNGRRSFAFAPGGNQLSFDVSFLERGNYVVRVRENARLVDVVKLVKT